MSPSFLRAARLLMHRQRRPPVLLRSPVRPQRPRPRFHWDLIGPNDVLEVMFWRDKDMSAEVTVRPDGKVSLPLINDIQAEALRRRSSG